MKYRWLGYLLLGLLLTGCRSSNRPPRPRAQFLPGEVFAEDGVRAIYIVLADGTQVWLVDTMKEPDPVRLNAITDTLGNVVSQVPLGVNLLVK